MKELIQHIKLNEDTFRFWIDRNEKLQPSNDLFSIIIPIYEKENPGVKAVNGCSECIIDMLRWCIKILKEDSKPETEKETKAK